MPSNALFQPAMAADGPAPVTPAQRLAAVDALRGFALAGVLLANLPLFSGDVYMSEAQRAALPSARWDGIARFVMSWLVDNKFMGLFAILFGVGFSLQLARAKARGGSSIRVYLRRLGWLMAIGLVHGWLAWNWDILRFYALWGLLLPLFDRLSNRTLLAAALLIGVIVPAVWETLVAMMGHGAGNGGAIDARTLSAFASGSYRDVLAANWEYDWYLTLGPTQGGYQAGVIGRMLLGAWLGRFLLAPPAGWRRALQRAAAWSFPVGLGGSLLFAFVQDVTRATWWASLPIAVGTLALTILYLSAFLLAFETDFGHRWLGRLAPVGRMSLSNYLLQTVVGLWLFYGFTGGPRLMGHLGLAALVPIWIVCYVLQVAGSHLWLRSFRFGPCEWLWRSLTYGQPQPMRCAAARAPSAAAEPDAIG